MMEGSNQTSRAEEFIQIFTNLEREIRAEYDLDTNVTTPLRWIAHEREEFASRKKEINQIVDIRNMLQHSPKYGGNYVVEPSQEILDSLKSISDMVLNPPRAHNAMIPMAKLLWASLDDEVLPKMIEMRDRGYTVIPILDDGIVVGAFSENSLLSYLIDERPEIVEGETFSQIKDYLDLDGRICEHFLFSGRNILAIELEHRFQKSRASGKFLGMVFVTQSGNAKEKLQGIITEYDVHSVLYK